MERKATRAEVYEALDGEREYQEIRWGVASCEGRTPEDHQHSVSEWLIYMQDYLTEAIHIVARNADPAASILALAHVRKITAMGVACMEQLGAQKRVV